MKTIKEEKQKLAKKNLSLENRIKKMIKWTIFETNIRNYEKILRTRNLKKEMVL